MVVVTNSFMSIISGCSFDSFCGAVFGYIFLSVNSGAFSELTNFLVRNIESFKIIEVATK